MSDAKHTPGPWTAQRAPKPTRHWVVNIPGDHPLVVGRTGGPDDIHERDGANARLMAAAPDLLAACEASLDAHHNAHDTGLAVRYPVRECEHPICATLRAAIAKARGES